PGVNSLIFAIFQLSLAAVDQLDLFSREAAL
ncbi:unnamed protein product, partial [marine sediment metagenome]